MRNRMLVVLVCLFCGEVLADSVGVMSMYTLRQRQLVSEDEMSDVQHKRIRDVIDGYFKADEALLFKCYDSLQKYLVETLDLSRCKETGWQRDNIVFSFYEYYLQFIPYCAEGKKYIYINAYKCGWDYSREKGLYESPVEHDMIVTACDGGSRFWSIQYDVERDEFFNMRVNGPGKGVD